MSPLAVRSQEVIALDEITVAVGPGAQATASQTTVGEERLETEYQGASLGTVLRDMAGVTTQGGGGDDGAEMAVNIRGLQDHGRVAVTVDGMRQNFARSGHGANGTFSVDQEMLREVTVTRGSGAKAGAIGGAVELRRVTAEDILREGASTGGEFRLRYGSLTKTPTVHGELAAKLSEAVDLMVAGTHSEKDDYTAPDGTRVYAGQTKRSGLATLGFNTENGQRFTLSYDRMEQEYSTGVAAGTPRDNDLRTESLRLGWQAEDLAGWSVEGALYKTDTKLEQQSLSAALTPTGTGRTYDTSTTGLLLSAQRFLMIGGRDHDLTVTLEGFRDEADVNDTTGSLTPSGSRDIWSLGLEDRFELGRARVTLGLTADSYSLDSDDGSASGQAVSPRLAVDVPLGNWVTFHAAASMGYRPPSLNETLVSGMHPEPADFEIRPNPDLKPEKSQAFEIGLGYGREGLFVPGDSFDVRATLFQNTVRDYIGLERVGSLFDSYYRYNNIDKVRLRGLELEARYDSGQIFAGLAGQILDGTDRTTGEDLDSTPPDRVVVTAGLRSADLRREVGTRVTFTDSKHGGTLSSDAWRTVDLFFRQEISKNVEFGLALNNIFDANYTPHLDTQPQPGFNAQASLTLRF
ncbi:TonB-dependent receptor domain-containing protein [Pseudodonghicola xiamenensis]|uniref:Ligand-gated channel n=1 Tax=Pseudodonghicola xiamenensis TaxID=337702 RepID=A0A8J3MBR1_9RHOB|nr:TonB-dependent receptor [Pseudodonghicola xiamenensis]GHG80334.1 ligand-gated channel [Pseudodonghicola xiamenensis]